LTHHGATRIGPSNIATSCEVKMRAGSRFGDPLEAVGFEKERRLRRAAEAFLARNRDLARLEVAFEVAAVRGRRIERVPL
jgi:Holliday junction resolvase-like predicted endonuclease